MSFRIWPESYEHVDMYKYIKTWYNRIKIGWLLRTELIVAIQIQSYKVALL